MDYDVWFIASAGSSSSSPVDSLLSWLVSIDCGTRSYQRSLSNFTLISTYTVKCSWAHTLVRRSKYILFFRHYWARWSHVIDCLSSHCWHCLHVLSVYVFNIFVARHLIFNALSGAAIISPSVRVFRFPPDSHRKVSTFHISCLSIFQICCSFITLLPHFFIKTFAFVPFLCHCFHLFGCNCSATVSPNLIVEFVFEWFACVDSNNIYKLVFFILHVQLFYNTDCLCFVNCYNPLPLRDRRSSGILCSVDW